MRRVIAEAEVGDHVLGDDPTADRLENRAAELLGKERALFFPSGTMANQAAIHLQTRPGTQVLVMLGAHVLHYEEGGAAAWSGVQMREVGAGPGELDLNGFLDALQPASRYTPEVSLVCLENTHNSGGGRILPLEGMKKVGERARELGIPVHLDGARLANAAVGSGISLPEWTSVADTVMVSLSKGLGAPIGSILAGSAEMMERGWRLRRRLGGAMRQVGILAAAGLYALEHNFARLGEDHRRARELAEAVNEIRGLHADPPQTNIVMIHVAEELGEASDFAATLARRGVLLAPFGGRRIRAVTHLDVDDHGIAHAIEVLGSEAR